MTCTRLLYKYIHTCSIISVRYEQTFINIHLHARPTIKIMSSVYAVPSTFRDEKLSETFVFSDVNCRGYAPKIIEHPADTTVAVHEPATLNCKSDGVPEPKIKWYQDGRLVNTDNQSVRKALLPEGSLLFLEALQGKREADSGTYWCVASNSFGEATSKKANLMVTCEYLLKICCKIRM